MAPVDFTEEGADDSEDIILDFPQDGGGQQEEWSPRQRSRKCEDVMSPAKVRKAPKRQTGGIRKRSEEECGPHKVRVEKPRQAVVCRSWRTPEVEAWQQEIERVSWQRMAAIAAVVVLLYNLSAMAGTMAEDMVLAHELDVPEEVMPTRSAYAKTPVVGPVFQMVCDVGDLVRVNSAFISRYAGAVPWIIATPVLLPAAAAAMPAITASGTAAASLLPLIR